MKSDRPGIGRRGDRLHALRVSPFGRPEEGRVEQRADATSTKSVSHRDEVDVCEATGGDDTEEVAGQDTRLASHHERISSALPQPERMVQRAEITAVPESREVFEDLGKQRWAVGRIKPNRLHASEDNAAEAGP